MRIRARMSTSADGYVTTPGGWPALTADPAFVSGESHGIREFLESCEQALMGRVTFEPALTNERWPWPDLDVFVLASQRPTDTPDHVAVESDPARVLPLFLGDGMRLTQSISVDASLELQSERALPGGSVEIVYRVGGGGSALPG